MKTKIYETVTANINPDGSPSIIAWRGRTFDMIPLSDGKCGTIRKVSAVDPRHLAALVAAARVALAAYDLRTPGTGGEEAQALEDALAPFITDPAPVPGGRYDARTGQYFPTLDGRDLSLSSFDESRALEIATLHLIR